MGVSILRDKNKTKAQEFADKWGCEVVDNYDDMVGKVDAVANGDLYNIPWQHQLLRPYIEAGIPCYLQRPWSNTLKNLDEIYEYDVIDTTQWTELAYAIKKHMSLETAFPDSPGELKLLLDYYM